MFLVALLLILAGALDAGAACTYSLTPTNRVHGHGAITGAVTLVTTANCSWNVVNTNPWVTIQSSLSGVGGATVTYALPANPTINDRTGVVLIAGQPLTVTQRGIPCELGISPTTRTHGYATATGTVSVTTSEPACRWGAVNTNPWVRLLSGASGTGDGTVTYAVDLNLTPEWRTGYLVVADQVLQLIQRPFPCTYSLSPVDRTHGHSAAAGSFEVRPSDTNCYWSAVSSSAWLQLISTVGSGGAPTGYVNYAVEPNLKPFWRTGVVQVADLSFTLLQRPYPCEWSISPLSRSHGYGATTGLVNVTTTTNCPWLVINTNAWVTLTANPDTGTAGLGYTLAANPNSSPRVGTLTIGDQVFSLSQAAAPCNYSLTPVSFVHGCNQETGQVTVATPGGCAWSPINTNAWITLLTPTNNSGGGTVLYRITPNPVATDRSGVLTIAGQPYVVTQRALSCEYEVSPAARTHGYATATGSVSVAMGSVLCPWTASKTATWITLLSGTSGAGPGTLVYSVAANSTLVDRTGVITVAGRSFTITQKGLACTWSISPETRTHGYSASTGTVTLEAAVASCSWTVSKTSTWVKITSPISGTGSADIGYTLDANSLTAWRTSVVSIATQRFTLVQRPFNCSFSLSPDLRNHGYAGSTGSVAVTTSSSCTWSVSTPNSWITLIAPSGGRATGTGVVSYIVAPNNASSARTGSVLVADQVFVVSQNPAPCSYSFQPNPVTNSYLAQTTTVAVTSLTGCDWTVTNTNNWITVLTSGAGSGNGSFAYRVTPNPLPVDRTATLQVGDDDFSVRQLANPCGVRLSPSSRSHGYGATTGQVSLATGTGCPWTVSNPNSWLTVLSAASGQGNNTLVYAVDENPAPFERVAVLTLQGQSLTLTQRAAICTLDLSPTSRLHGHGASTGTVALATLAGCPWTAVNTNPWIRLPDGGSGFGPGSLLYVLEPNPLPAERTGLVMIAEQTLTIRQRAQPCTQSISPTNRVHGYGGSTGTIAVATGAACSWAVINTNSWINILTGPGGTGDGYVGYTVAFNPTTTDRSGAVAIGDQWLTVTQRGQGTASTMAIASIIYLGNGSVRLALTGGTAGVWQLQSSEDLVTWTGVSFLTNVTGALNYTDTRPGGVQQRFYRVVTP